MHTRTRAEWYLTIFFKIWHSHGQTFLLVELQLLKGENDVKFTYIYCDDHPSLSSTTAVQIRIISYKLHISLTHLIIHQVKKRKSTVEEKTYQTFETVSSAIQTPRISSKTLRCLPLVFQTLYLASRGSFLASLNRCDAPQPHGNACYAG